MPEKPKPNVDERPDDIVEKVREKGAKTKKKKKHFPVVPILVLLGLIGGIVAVMGFNVFNVRNQYIVPALQNIPVFGSLLPLPELTPPPEGRSAADYEGMSGLALQNLVTGLEDQIRLLETDMKTVTDLNAQYETVIKRLQAYEQLMDEYRRVKQAFDTMVAYGDPKGYMQFFEEVSPENAAQLYKEVVSQVSYSDEVKRFASTYVEMDAASAADAFELMLTTNADLVVMILRSIDSVSRGAIYDEMDAASVAVVSRLMAPTAAPVTPMPTAPPLPTPSPEPEWEEEEEGEGEEEEIEDSQP